MKKRPILIGLTILLILIIAIALNGVVRETIAPALLAWVWRVSLMSRGFPQVIVWAFFIALIPIIAVFSLLEGRPSEIETAIVEDQRYEGQVTTWIKLLHQAHEGAYFRKQMLRPLANLTLYTLAYKERLTRAETKEMLADGQIAITPEMQKFLDDGLKARSHSQRTTSRRAKKSSQTQAAWKDPEIENILQFLENELEVKREN
ncbi:MAG: hypothetical protein GY796_00860 [Chloroflexi bacterium]|nr:hypothetical protein [Chloroflexota bacterium]